MCSNCHPTIDLEDLTAEELESYADMIEAKEAEPSQD